MPLQNGNQVGREEGKRWWAVQAPRGVSQGRPEVQARRVGRGLTLQEEGREDKARGFYGVGAELDAYVSRGILACPCVGGREVLESSRLSMTVVFRREAGATGHGQQGLRWWGALVSGWNLGSPGMVSLQSSG